MSFNPEKRHFKEEKDKKEKEELGKSQRKKQLYKIYEQSVSKSEFQRQMKAGKLDFKEVKKKVDEKVKDREKMLKEIKEKREKKEKE